jgi:hypothetical protein
VVAAIPTGAVVRYAALFGVHTADRLVHAAIILQAAILVLYIAYIASRGHRRLFVSADLIRHPSTSEVATDLSD